MATIKLTKSNYTPIPEGTYVFKITAVDYNDTFEKLSIKMETAEGYTHTEKFAFKTGDNKPNDVARSIFSFLARTALNDFTRDNIDPTELVGHYFKGEIYLEEPKEANDGSGRMIQFRHLGKKYPADGFENEPAPAPAPVKQTAGGFDLGKLLG